MSLSVAVCLQPKKVGLDWAKENKPSILLILGYKTFVSPGSPAAPEEGPAGVQTWPTVQAVCGSVWPVWLLVGPPGRSTASGQHLHEMPRPAATTSRTQPPLSHFATCQHILQGQTGVHYLPCYCHWCLTIKLWSSSSSTSLSHESIVSCRG
jgi:hypothetical protein